MSNMKTFNDFLFTSELKKELKYLLDTPERIPSPLCFYGRPGNGKTSFAEYIAKTLCSEVCYYDMNEYKKNGASSGELLRAVNNYASMATLSDESKPLGKCIILDEWHNATHSQQDAYKVPFETYSQKANVLFILCLNTDWELPIEKALSPAIKSRCHCISFNTRSSQLPELRALVREKYPTLSDIQIATALPDMRVIQRLADMYSA
ncbi:AAA family ATPase [Denitrovibrio acetiphilus]|nr:AAA family ATPase [Denitrovibrio acetiphilus]